jgi:hypothetical protein
MRQTGFPSFVNPCQFCSAARGFVVTRRWASSKVSCSAAVRLSLHLSLSFRKSSFVILPARARSKRSLNSFWSSPAWRWLTVKEQCQFVSSQQFLPSRERVAVFRSWEGSNCALSPIGGIWP